MKVKNGYVHRLPQKFYDQTPKAVFAAIAISALNLISGDEVVNSDDDYAVLNAVLNEWQALHSNSIVKQKPPGKFKFAQQITES